MCFGALLAFWVLLHVKDLVIYHSDRVISQVQIDWIMIIDQLTVPMCVVMQLKIIRAKWLNNIRAFLIIVPFIMLLALYAVAPNPLIIVSALILSVIYSIFIVIYTVLVCRQLPMNLPNRKTAYLIIDSFVVIFISWVLSCIFTSTLTDIFYYVLSGVAWTVIYYAVEYIYDEKDFHQELPNGSDVIPVAHEYPFVDSFSQLMEVEKAYLNPEISIVEVARQIGTNRSYLSDFLNHNCNSTFIDYVNNLRLEYAERLMKEDSNISIEAISISSGFNSLSTFRRAFSKKYGSTPSKYRNNLYDVEKT